MRIIPRSSCAFLLRTRRQAAQLLSADKPLSDRLEDLLAFAKTAQQELTGEAVVLSAVELPELYAGLEYIDEDNRGRLVAASERAPEFRAYDKELTNLALYWLYRYWLGAIDSLDLIAPTRFLIASVKTVANLSKDEDIVAAAQRYSKEIEQSYENMEILGSLW